MAAILSEGKFEIFLSGVFINKFEVRKENVIYMQIC